MKSKVPVQEGASTNKKVIVQRFQREPLSGYLNPRTSFLTDRLGLLDLQGRFVHLPYEEIKLVCFVKDLDGTALGEERRIFTSRPKSPGLWVRAQFRDNDFLDGLLANDLLHMDPAGFMLIPPDPSSNTQRVFIPRQALVELRVLGVVGVGAPRKRRQPPAADQIKLFEDSP